MFYDNDMTCRNSIYLRGILFIFANNSVVGVCKCLTLVNSIVGHGQVLDIQSF